MKKIWRSWSTSSQVLLLIVLAVSLRLPLLGGSFWLDEAAQALESARPLSQQLHIAQDFQPPLLHLLVHFAMLVSQHEWWLRSIGALLPGILTIYITYKIGERLFTKTTGLLAALLLATSSFHIFYSQELRPYSLSALWTVLSWWLLLDATESEKTKKLNLKLVIFLGLTTAAGLYSTYLYPFVVLSQWIYVIWLRRTFFVSLCSSYAVSAVLFVPWLPSLLEQLRVGQLLRVQLPGWEKVVAIPQFKSLPLTAGKFIFGVLNLDLNVGFILATLVVLALTSYLVWHNKKELTSKRCMALFIWLVVPLLTAWLISFVVPILQPKRVIFLLPAFYLLMSALSVTLAKQKKLGWFSVGQGLFISLFAINIFSTFSYYINPQLQRENWRSLHTKITEQYSHNSVVVFGFNGVFAPWVWYDDGKYPVITAGAFSDTPEKISEQLKPVVNYSYVLVFDYLRDLTDPGHTIESELQNLGYTQKDLFAVPQIGFIRVYARQSAVLSER